MTGFSKFATNCERAREWSSLRLDGELPQLQRAMLRKHLAACHYPLESWPLTAAEIRRPSSRAETPEPSPVQQ